MIKIIVPERLPSLNEVINANRANRYAGAKLKKQIDQLLCIYIKNQCKAKFERIFIYIDWYEPNKKRDYDNIVSSKKFILDALVKCQVIPNDGWKQIEPVFIDNIHYDKNNGRVEITIIESTNYDDRIKYNSLLIKKLTKEQEQLFYKREEQRSISDGQIELEIT